MTLLDINDNLISEQSFCSVVNEKLRQDAYFCPKCLKVVCEDDIDLKKRAKNCRCKSFLKDGITKITALKQLGSRTEFINRLGQMSKCLQGIDYPVTTVKRFKQNRLIVYVYAENGYPKGFIATGYYKGVFQVTDLMVLPPYQRQGIGHKLFDFVLNDTGISVNDLKIDVPSSKCRDMIEKYYSVDVWETRSS